MGIHSGSFTDLILLLALAVMERHLTGKFNYNYLSVSHNLGILIKFLIPLLGRSLKSKQWPKLNKQTKNCIYLVSVFMIVWPFKNSQNLRATHLLPQYLLWLQSAVMKQISWQENCFRQNLKPGLWLASLNNKNNSAVIWKNFHLSAIPWYKERNYCGGLR